MYSIAIEPSQLPDPETSDVTRTSDHRSPKPKVLAAWTSLKSARQLSDFCTTVCESVGSFDFEVVPARDLEVREAASREAPDYRALLLAFSPEDTVSPRTERYLRSWVARSVENGEKPMIICREGPPTPGRETKGTPSWNSVVEGFAKEFEAYVIWDSRPLPSAGDEAA